MSAVPSHHPKYRTKLCRNFTNGNCPFGQKCTFIHPAQGINPLSSLAQYLLSWNMFLPHLLSLSNQQAALKKIPPRSPPRSHGPQLIDEDPSPSSLLLSTSDCMTLEKVQQMSRSSRRKKICRQFIRTGGWCSAGAKCRFHHDVATLPSAVPRKADQAPPLEIDVHASGGRTISGGVLMGIQSPSPPVIAHEPDCLEPPRYSEAAPGQPCQPMYWPSHTWQPYHPYYATVPVAVAVPVPATSTVAPSAMQHNMYHPPPQPLVHTAPPSTEGRTCLPLGTYQVNGTTYFPTQMPSVPAPVPMTSSIPVHPTPYAPAYPYYAPPPLPTGYYDIPNHTIHVRPQPSFDPFSSDPMMPSELPVVPRPEDYQVSPIQHDDFSRRLSSPFVLSGDMGFIKTADLKVVQAQEFPYRPPKHQQVGHARRISINIKKQHFTGSG